MSDDLALDAATIDAQLAERAPVAYASPWHARRALGFGASDVPALLVGLGLRDAESAPGHVQSNAAPTKIAVGPTVHSVPRMVAEKAGRKRPLASGRAAAIGTAREYELLLAWRDSLHESSMYDPTSIWHASAIPRTYQAGQRDVECPILAASYDAGCVDVLGDEIVVELKCGHVERENVPWHWRAQIQAQLACCGLARGLLVLGQMWARGPDVHGPIVAWPVERDEGEIEEIRSAVRRAWAMVESIRGGE